MRIGPIPVLVLCLGFAAVSTAWAQPQATKVALLAGVNAYDSPEFSFLSYAERDATVLGDELKKHGFTVVTLTGSGKAANRATKDNILAKLRGLHPKPNREVHFPRVNLTAYAVSNGRLGIRAVHDS